MSAVKRLKLHHCAKFRRNRTNRGYDMVSLDFFNMAAAAILDFSNLKFVTIGTVKIIELRHCAKFCRNRSNRGRDMVIFRLFKMAAAAMSDFKNFKF